MIPITKSTLIGLISLSLSLSGVQAQPDATRMQQELDLMESAIKELFESGNPDSKRFRVRTHGVEASYTPGFGLVIRTPVYHQGNSLGQIYLGNSNYSYQFNGNQIRVVPEDHYFPKPDPSPTPSPAPAPQAAPAPSPPGTPDPDPVDLTDAQAVGDSILALMQYFLANYGDLAREIPAKEKIMLLYAPRTHRQPLIISQQGKLATVSRLPEESFSVSVLRGEIDALRKGELSTRQLINKMEIRRSGPRQRNEWEYQVMERILQDVVSVDRYRELLEESDSDAEEEDEQDDEASVFFGKGHYRFEFGDMSFGGKSRASYEVLAGFGVTYTLQSQLPLNYGVQVITSGRGNRSRANYSGKFKAAGKWLDDYAEAVVEELKRSMIEYGRTLRRLGKDEWLVVKLSLPPCESCDAPAQIELRVPQQVLEQYDARNLSLNSAMDRIDQRNTGKASDPKRNLSGSVIWSD